MNLQWWRFQKKTLKWKKKPCSFQGTTFYFSYYVVIKVCFLSKGCANQQITIEKTNISKGAFTLTVNPCVSPIALRFRRTS